MGFKSYVAKRAVFSLVVVLVVALVAFVLVHLAPGDPAVLLGGEGATPQYLQQVRAAYGLNLPITQQLVIYFEKLLQGNLGFSITYDQPVLSVIMSRLPNTLLLVGTALVLSIIVGMFLGIFSATRAYSKKDRTVTSISILLYSTPVFVTGLVLIYLFVVLVRIFPAGGMFTFGTQTNPLAYVFSVIYHMVLPVASLSTFFLATYILLTRAGLIESLGANYITMARAKGVPERTVVYKHALRNALLPVITVAGVQLGLIVTGAVLTESIFSWPGVGTLLLQAVEARDYSLVTGIFIVAAVSVAIANFAADLLYGFVDPRIRTEA